MAGSGITGNVQGHIWLIPLQNGIIPPSTKVSLPHQVVQLYGTQYQAITDMNGNYNLLQGQPGTDQVYSAFENENMRLRVYEYASPGYTIDYHLSTMTTWEWDDTTNHDGEYNVFYWLNYMHEHFEENFYYAILGNVQLDVQMYHPQATVYFKKNGWICLIHHTSMKTVFKIMIRIIMD